MSYDEQIAVLQQQKQRLFNEMETKKELLLKELAIFTFNWFEKETLLTIKANSDKVIELGEDKARKLKCKVKELKERTPELVKQYMDEKHLWWHTNEDKSYYSGNHRLLGNHEKNIKIMFGELGKILIEYGIVRGNTEYDKDNSSCWSYEGYDKSKLRYGYGLEFSKELYSITKQYIELIKQAQEINEQIIKIEEQKKRENVEDWWESL